MSWPSICTSALALAASRLSIRKRRAGEDNNKGLHVTIADQVITQDDDVSRDAGNPTRDEVYLDTRTEIILSTYIHFTNLDLDPAQGRMALAG
jgi:hypothetical protein